MANHLIPFRGLRTTAGCSLFRLKVTYLACHSERARASRASRSACPDRSRGNLRFRPLEHFHTWCIGWSTASAVQLGFGNETALAAEVTEPLPQALKRDPRIDGSYARLKACSTHRLYTRCETALAPVLIRTLGLIPGGVTRHLAVKALGGQKKAGATRARDASLRRAL